jgi:hypothetical protein
MIDVLLLCPEGSLGLTRQAERVVRGPLQDSSSQLAIYRNFGAPRLKAQECLLSSIALETI